MKTTAQKLSHAIRLLKKGWIRNASAKDKNNLKVTPTSKKAVKFCMYGAMRHAGFSDEDTYEMEKFLPKSASGCFAIYNDDIAKTRQQPIAVLRKALKFYKKK